MKEVRRMCRWIFEARTREKGHKATHVRETVFLRGG